MTPGALTPALLAQVAVWTATTFGLRFEIERWGDLTRGLTAAARELGIDDLTRWAAELAAGESPAEHVATVANHLTISETYFFRHPDHFARLEQVILPSRLAARTGTPAGLRIWSAGCASGEEPYSVAVLLHRRFGPAVLRHSHVIGTDLSRQVIARAKAAKYSHWSFRDAPEWLEPAYFTPAGLGRVQLIPELRQQVTFRVLNLASPLYPAEFGPGANFDVILCRNVLMYLSAGHQHEVLRRFAAALAPEGWLLTGPCDVTGEVAAALGLMAESPGLFRKRAAGEAVTAQPALIEPPITCAPPAPEDRRDDRTNLAPDFPREEVSTAPASEPSSAAQAWSLADRGELVAALEACDAALTADKTNADLYYLRGCILHEQDQLAEAEQTFRRGPFRARLRPGTPGTGR